MEVAILNPDNQPILGNDRTALRDMENLDIVKVEYRKVTGCSANSGWTAASGTDGETINFKNLEESVGGVVRAVWDISNLSDYEYEIRLKSACMNSNGRLPLKLRQFYSDPIVGLIDKTPPQVYGVPQPAANFSP